MARQFLETVRSLVKRIALSLMNVDVSPWHTIGARILVVCGLSVVFAAVNVVAFRSFTPARRAVAAISFIPVVSPFAEVR